MRFKLFFILIILNFLFSQSLLNRALGNNETFGSSRSYAMGFTHSLNANNSALVQYNPSLILYTASNKKLVFDLQTNLSMIKERRSILVKDYFGDFLTYADYVSNSNHYNYKFSLYKKIRPDITIVGSGLFNANDISKRYEKLMNA